MIRALTAAASMACLAACAAGTAPLDRAAAPLAASEVERFLPLYDGHVLSYWVYVDGGASPEQAIFQVARTDAAHASLRSGSTVRELVLAPDGIRSATGGYLLRAPLVPGARWDGPIGLVQLVAIDQSIAVSAGHFSGCIETREATLGTEPRQIATVYCPGVGITQITIEGGDRFELRSYGQRVDLDAR